jgi:hypothetical protein
MLYSTWIHRNATRITTIRSPNTTHNILPFGFLDIVPISSQVATVSVEGGLVGTPDPGQKLPRIRANMATWDQDEVTGSTTGSKRDLDGGEVSLDSVSERSGEMVCEMGAAVGLGIIRIRTGRGSR